jgi:hypothetical protein
MPRGERARSGDALLSPAAVLAVAVLLVNDHVLKRAYPGWVTGKLSDVAGLVFFPLLLVSAWELCARRAPSLRALAVACAATALVFVAVKLWPPAGACYRWGLAVAQWPFRALAALGRGAGLPSLAPVSLVRDPTDLLALPALALAWAAGRRRPDMGVVVPPSGDPTAS